MRRYGIIVMEMIDEESNGKFLPLRPKHREEEIFRQIISERDFDLKHILWAILKGMESKGPQSA